jgi:hypothetical protein
VDRLLRPVPFEEKLVQVVGGKMAPLKKAAVSFHERTPVRPLE